MDLTQLRNDFSNNEFVIYWSLVYDKLSIALVSSYTSAGHWVHLTTFLLRPVFHLLLVLIQLLIPHVQVWTQALVDYIISLPPSTLLKISLSLFFILYTYFAGYWTSTAKFFRKSKRQISVSYRNTRENITAKSKVAGVVLPHVLYISALVLVYYVTPSSLQLEVAEVAVPFLSFIYPVFQSVRVLLRTTQPTSPRIKSPKSSKKKDRRRRLRSSSSVIEEDQVPYLLQYWILWSVVITVTGIISFFVTSHIEYYLDFPTRVAASTLCWMHFLGGTCILYRNAGPLIFSNIDKIPDHRLEEKAGMLLSTLSIFISKKYVDFISDCWSQGPALIGIMFLFTPGFITYRAGLVIGCMLPAANAVSSIKAEDARNVEWWLTYYAVLAVFEYIVTGIGNAFSWLPLFYHVKLLALLWLQFPYFRGAQRIFNKIFLKELKVD